MFALVVSQPVAGRKSERERWLENLAPEPASTASDSSGIGLNIADSEIVSMPTVIPAARQPSFHCGTSACRGCRTARANKRCVLQWRNSCALATAVAVSEEVLRHAAHSVMSRYPLNLPPHTSRVTHRVLSKAGVGNGIGAGSIASLSRTKGLITTSVSHTARPDKTP